MAAAKPVAARPNATPQNPPRRDPPRRHIDGTMPWAKLKSTRTGRTISNGVCPDGHHHVLVYENSPDALADYADKGYVPCFWGQGDVVPLGGKTGKQGDPIIVRGHLLMRCEASVYQQILDDGQAIADEKHDKIFRKKRPAEFEPMRRTRDGALYADFRNQSSSSVEDLFEQSEETA